MSTGYIDGNTKTFTAGAAIAENLRVYLSSSKLAAAGATTIDIGTMTRASFTDGDIIAVRLCNASGTTKMVASKAITADSIVYTAASGKVSDEQASGASRVGIAITAASDDGDVIEVLRD
jgi:hypothetical protein